MPLTNDIAAASNDSTSDDSAIEDWLRDEVAPVFDAMKADPARALRAEDVFAKLARHIDGVEQRRR